MGCAQPREEDIRVVEVRPVCVDDIGAVDAEVDDDDFGGSQQPRGFDHVRRRAVDDARQLREGHRGDETVVPRLGAVGERQYSLARVDRGDAMAKAHVGRLHEATQVADEAAVAGIAKLGDVMDVRRLRAQCPGQHLLQLRPVQARTDPVGR